MRFYLPDWDDNVDGEYDFIHDENSQLRKQERPLEYIWDIYGREEAPVDGILISREQIEGSKSKSKRIRDNGIYHEIGGGMPKWLPTICDCGAWGYRELPRPVYGSEEMMEFYTDVDVTVGVTIDHLIFDSEPVDRLYLDERALPDEFAENEHLPDGLDSEGIEVSVTPWRTDDNIETFDPSQYDSMTELRKTVEDIDCAEFIENDPKHRYDLTLKNAQQMRELYDARDDRPFRLMAAIQGWSPETYADAAEQVIEMGYDYIGIGGVAASSVGFVEDVVEAVGEVIEEYENKRRKRIDAHIFGFAKNDAFDQIRRSGISSFDSASMLRMSWTGGDNYHLSNEQKYTGIRVHPSTPQHSFRRALELEFHGQPVLQALRAYDRRDSIIEAIEEWRNEARTTLDGLADYLEQNRHDERFDVSSMIDARQALRDDYEHGRMLGSSFGKLRREVARLLREDSADSPLQFEEYQKLIDTAEEVWEEWTPGLLSVAQQSAKIYGDDERFHQLMWMLREYVQDFDEESYLSAYSETLRDRPWEECSCPICERMGIDVAIFRRNNRNRRRGFHNIYQFYQEFTSELPNVIIATPAKSDLLRYETVGDYLQNGEAPFWNKTHDIPVCELGVVSAAGFSEWWQSPPDSVSNDPSSMIETLEPKASRYQHLLVYGQLNDAVREALEQSGCDVRSYQDLTTLRSDALSLIGDDATVAPAEGTSQGEI